MRKLLAAAGPVGLLALFAAVPVGFAGKARPSTLNFDWLDAAAGFGLAIVSVAAVLLVVVAHRPHLRWSTN